MSEVVLRPDAVSEVAQLPPLTEEQSHVVIEQVWRFFCSLRLTLFNFLGLFLGMIAGTFVNPANDSLTNIEHAFATRPGVLWAYRTFELYDLFHSWWFTTLLLSLALNLIACSLERLPRIYILVRWPQLRLEDVKGLRFKAPERESALTPGEVQARLRARGYRIRSTPRDDGGADIFAERGRYARFGVWIIHTFLLVVLGGGIIGRLTAFEGTADVPQNGGEADEMIIRNPDGSALRRKLGFVVKCDDFRLKEFSPGRPKAFESDLRVLSQPGPGAPGGQELARETITVNHPLKYGGLTFYQASYRQMDESQHAKVALIDKATGQKRELMVAAGDGIDAAEGLTYQLTDYSEDFAGLGPAVQVVRTEEAPGAAVREAKGPRRAPPAQAKVTSFWVFKNKPDFDKDNREDRFALQFDRLATLYATGLQIARDPSIPFVYTGCFGIFLGIGIAFYTSHKRLWARVARGTLALGGAAHRNTEAFAKEFDEVRAALGLA